MPSCNSSFHSPLSHEIGLNGELTPKHALVARLSLSGELSIRKGRLCVKKRTQRKLEAEPASSAQMQGNHPSSCGDTSQGCVILKKMARDDKGLVGEGSGCFDFHPGLGHGGEDPGMREIQCIPSAALS